MTARRGIIGKVRDGFEYFDRDNDGRGFWFCRMWPRTPLRLFSTMAWRLNTRRKVNYSTRLPFQSPPASV